MKNIASIIIRTKNEERWISQCLRGVFSQDYGNFEVILVDNKSTDKTVDKARQAGVLKILQCDEYLPGRALNIGIREASGDYIVCLSGHCIPADEKWLSRLAENFGDESVAGVYGRQEPMDFTPDRDKRDLALVFGLDRRVQVKDSFFHNANSMIRKEIWDKVPFDEKVTNIEDRVWAKEVLARGYRIVYEPRASVYHYHGIHQNGDEARCSSVVKILESIKPGSSYASLDAEKLNIVAIIPMRGPMRYLNGKPLVSYTIERAVRSKFIKKTVVSTDCEEVARAAREAGAEVPFLREAALSEAHVDIAKVYQYSLKKIEQGGIFPDLVVCLEPTFPFRSRSLLDGMILRTVQNGFDSVIAARRENKGIWKKVGGEIVEIEEGITPRQFKDPTFIELRGIGCVTHPGILREGNILGKKIGIYEIDDPYSPIEVRNDEGLRIGEYLTGKYFENGGGGDDK